MSPEFYLIAHVVGVLMLVLGLGGMLASNRDAKAPAMFAALHGLGLIAIVVAGVGRAHKLQYAWTLWLYGKIGCWVLLAVLPVLYRRGVLSRLAALIVVLVVGGVAAWLAATKPM